MCSFFVHLCSQWSRNLQHETFLCTALQQHKQLLAAPSIKICLPRFIPENMNYSIESPSTQLPDNANS